MIGLDIPGDSRIRDQNTNGPLSQRWQPVVGVYNLAVISTNLTNQITAIHRSLSPSLMAYTVCSALELREMKGERQADRSCFWEDGKTERKIVSKWKYSSFSFREEGETERHSSFRFTYSSLWCKSVCPEGLPHIIKLGICRVWASVHV